MRISPQEIRSIVDQVKKFDPNARIYLHGSRLSDDLKGGDIDLFVEVTSDRYQDLSSNHHRLIAAIKKDLGDRRIDLTLVNRDAPEQFFLDSDKKEL